VGSWHFTGGVVYDEQESVQISIQSASTGGFAQSPNRIARCRYQTTVRQRSLPKPHSSHRGQMFLTDRQVSISSPSRSVRSELPVLERYEIQQCVFLRKLSKPAPSFSAWSTSQRSRGELSRDDEQLAESWTLTEHACA
jgi:hypothetical protein